MAVGKETGFKISPDELKTIAEQMEALPHIRDAEITTKAKAIAELAPAVKAMREKGYSIDQIASWISHNTRIKVTTNTLRDGIKPRRRTVKQPVRQTRKKSGDTQSTAPKIELTGQTEATSSSIPGSFALGSDDV